MTRIYDSIDFDWTWDGDFLIDSQGDLKDTGENLLLSFQNEVFTIVKSDLQDWREDPGVGADLGDFIGEPNTSDIGKSIEQRVRASLALIADTSDTDVRVVPVGIHRVLIAITFQVLATQANRLRSGDTVSVSFLYDYFERGIFVPLEDLNKFSGRNI